MGSRTRAAGAVARDLGVRAERAVANLLRSEGCVIVATNLRVGRLEIDIVAREGGVIAVVEVRARGPGAWVRAFDSVDARKQARVRCAGERLWRDQFESDLTALRMRFDIATVDFYAGGGPRIELVKAAF